MGRFEWALSNGRSLSRGRFDSEEEARKACERLAQSHKGTSYVPVKVRLSEEVLS